MTITVNDPGFRLGMIIKQSRPYLIEMKREDGVVFKVIEVSPQIYNLVTIPYLLAQLLLTSVLLFSGMMSAESFLSLASPGASIFVVQIVSIMLSFKQVNTDMYGGVAFFDRPVRQVSSGLVFLPWPFFGLKFLSKTPTQVQFPGDGERTFKGGDKKYFELSPEDRAAFVLPIRALTAGPKADAGVDGAEILDTQMTIEPTFTVRFVVDHFWVFLISIGTDTEAIRQMRDAGEKALIEEIAKRTPRQVAESISEISEALRAALEKATEAWGISIVDVSMLSPDLSHDVNAALQAITVAKAAARKLEIDTEAAAKATERQAAASKVQLTLEGEGVAAAELALLDALAEGSKKMGVDGDALIDLKKVEALGGKATIIVDGGQGASWVGLGTRVAAGAAVVQNKDTQE